MVQVLEQTAYRLPGTSRTETCTIRIPRTDAAEAEEGTTPQFLFSLEIDEDYAADDDMVEAEIRVRELLEEMPLPETNLDERAWKEQWLKLPRTARAAIRKMHEQFGHCRKGPLIEILRASKSPEEYIDAA